MTRLLRALAICLVFVVAASPAAAHQLIVFASIQSGTLVVEAKFSSGKKPKTGVVRIYDAADKLLHESEIAEPGRYRVALSQLGASAETGLRIAVDAGSGHEDYWVLTPDDIAKQRAASAKTGD